MPRAPFPRELVKWLRKHVEAGDISRGTANNLWVLALNDFPDVDFYSRRRGRPGAPYFAITIPGLDIDHIECFGKDIIKQYLERFPPNSSKNLAQFAITLKDCGCWYKDKDGKYNDAKSMFNQLTAILDELNVKKKMHYEQFTQALRDIEEGVEGSYNEIVRAMEEGIFKTHLEEATRETMAKELPEDYIPEII